LYFNSNLISDEYVTVLVLVINQLDAQNLVL